MLAQITDYAARAQARILSQYKTKALFVALIGELGGTVQTLEDALWALIAKTAIATADGVWLDYLGALIGEARQGASDGNYRIYIAARIRANQTRGRINDVLAVLKVLSFGVLPALTLVEKFPAGIELTWPGVLFDAELQRLRGLLRGTRAGGIGFSLLYQFDVDANSVYFADDVTPQASYTQGLGDTDDPFAGGNSAGAVRV